MLVNRKGLRTSDLSGASVIRICFSQMERRFRSKRKSWQGKQRNQQPTLSIIGPKRNARSSEICQQAFSMSCRCAMTSQRKSQCSSQLLRTSLGHLSGSLQNATHRLQEEEQSVCIVVEMQMTLQLPIWMRT
jgi:hypothetical protein